jgi:hypothetical protein
MPTITKIYPDIGGEISRYARLQDEGGGESIVEISTLSENDPDEGDDAAFRVHILSQLVEQSRQGK